MIIAKKEAKNKMKMYRSSLNEIESFSMLIISVDEAHKLLDAGNWEKVDNYMLTTYQCKDNLDNMWNTVAVNHQKKNPDFKDVSKWYVSDITGTSMLVRNDQKKEIYICRRKPKGRNNINILNISDFDRELFFKDCKICDLFIQNHRYGIDLRNERLYLKWSDYMNKRYLEALSK